jgi:hypothetical protein
MSINTFEKIPTTYCLRNILKETDMNFKWLALVLITPLLFGSEASSSQNKSYQSGVLQTIPIEKNIAAAKLAEAIKQAKTGDPEAMALLLGSEVEKNLPEARVWLLRAAEKGQRDAQAKLGAVWFLGLGGPVDFPQAVKWFNAAAEQGEVHAMGCLGFMYMTGSGVPLSAPDAFFWLILAQEGGDTSVTDKMLNDIASHLSPEQREQLLQRLDDFLKKQEQLHF